jgi:hypothetical protein
MITAFLLAWVCCAFGEEESIAAAAARNFHEAQERHKKEPENSEAAWQFARACFDYADVATSKSQRAQIASQGIAACQEVIAKESNSAPAVYYYGMNLAQLAQTKGLGALKIVRQMEREFLLVRTLDEHFDYAGADRNLGLLYRDAPSLGSIGDRAKARQHLQRAVELAPPYPENQLNLIESDLKWREREAASRQLKQLEGLLPEAHAKFAGAAWAARWTDWERRLKQIKKRTEGSPKNLEAHGSE